MIKVAFKCETNAFILRLFGAIFPAKRGSLSCFVEIPIARGSHSEAETSLCHALGQSGRAKMVSEQEKNGEMRREPISIFLNTAKRPLPRPRPEKLFLLPKCQKVRCRRFSHARHVEANDGRKC